VIHTIDTTEVSGIGNRYATATTVSRLRPRYEGSNICTWIGFKHVNYLVEEAVLDHLRQLGVAPGALYETYGLCADIVEIDTRIMRAFHIDDVAIVAVRPDPRARGLAFAITAYREADPDVKAVTSKVRVVLRLDPRGGSAEPVPAELQPYVVPTLAGRPGAAITLPDDPDIEGAIVDRLTAESNTFAFKFRIPYFYCHFTERLQMSGYLRLMEDAVDRFLASRGVSIKTLLDEQNWIPVVPHSGIEILDEALMEEDLYVAFTVEDVFKDLTYTARMDCYVPRGGGLVPVATGRITHGYAVIENRQDWKVVNFDDRLSSALAGRGDRR
jgi:acyl-CoA thioesterase FadM